jgi:3,4-dihydroxy-2-butanone 4-phosphate synthase
VTDLTPTQILDDELHMENLDAELSAIPLDEVTRAIKDIADGRPVIVVDDADRENEGDIIFAAGKATPELLAFMVRYSSGVICVPMRGEDLDRLQIPLMTTQNTERMRTAYTVSVDAAVGVTTGISAADRTTTIRKLAESEAAAGDFNRPGHIFPGARPPWSHRSGGRPGRPGGPGAGRRGVRGGQRRRHDDAPARPAEVR